MSVKTKAQLTTENAAQITSQTAQDTITPTVHGGVNQDIIDSMVNQADLLINGVTLDNYVIALINNNLTMSGIENPNLFRATKTLDQLLTATAGPNNNRLVFEDDTTAPNRDNSNLFYRDQFVANAPMTKTFALEGIVLKATNNTDTYRIRILKNGNELVPTSGAITVAATAVSLVDIYGNHTNSTDGYTFPPLIVANVTLAQGDVVTAEMINTYSSGTPKVSAGIFSNA